MIKFRFREKLKEMLGKTVFKKSVKLTLTIKCSFRRSADLHLKYLRYEQCKAGMSDLHQKWVKLVQMGKTRDF